MVLALVTEEEIAKVKRDVSKKKKKKNTTTPKAFKTRMKATLIAEEFMDFMHNWGSGGTRNRQTKELKWDDSRESCMN